ncbi:hypothetical protein ACWD7Y_04525 [Streptomyces drozdowiczii]
MSFRLVPLDERRLAGDPHADLPIQLRVRGRYLEPVDGIEVADIELRLDSATLTDLLAQGRAAQLTLAQRARRDAEAVAEASELGAGPSGLARSDTATLERVVVGLRALPDQDLPAWGGLPAGGSANGKPVGGEVRERDGELNSSPCKPPLPRRQSGRGGYRLRREG